MAEHPLRPAIHRCLGRPLPHQLANRTRAHLQAIACKQRPPLISKKINPEISSGISTSLEVLSRTRRQFTHALLTRSPLYSPSRSQDFSYDLHVLGTPQAFVLSQDQTLRIFFFHLYELSQLIPEHAIQFSKSFNLYDC